MTSVRDVTSQWLRARGLATVFAVLGLVGFAGHHAHALTAAVRDEASFFKPETVTQANEIIAEIRQKYKKDLLVDTLRDVPAAERQQATSADPSVKARFFADWAVRRAREEGVNGIYVLITRAPGHVEVAVGNTTRMVFPDEERHQLTQILLSHFKKKEYDEGLLEAVRFVRSTLAARSKASGAAPSAGPAYTMPPHERRGAAGSAGWGLSHWLMLGLAVLLGIWLLSAIVRAMAGAGANRTSGGYPGYGGPAGYGPAGGGGFFPSLLGGLFGAAAGSWLYDRFSGGQSPLAAEPPPPSAPGPEDTDYTAEGGDFNSTDTSGGDHGGDFDADDSQGDDSSTGGDDDGGDFGGDDDSGGGF